MELFFDPLSKAPITQIVLLEGQTTVVGIKKAKLGPPDGVIITHRNMRIAVCIQVVKLRSSKHALDGNYDLENVVRDTMPVETADTIFFQISGMSAGTTALDATLSQKSSTEPYAMSIPITVIANKKSLNLGASFGALWDAHPYNNPPPFLNQTRFKFQLCDTDPEQAHSCMIRFCTTLKRAGVGLHGFPPTNRCRKSGPEHSHHFFWPYDFEKWHGATDAYVWEAKPFQPEPMPGLAAYWFVSGKQGVILFWDYFPIKIGKISTKFPHGEPEKGDHGGHIDLWKEHSMGNDYMFRQANLNPIHADSAFARARKIVFWPM